MKILIADDEAEIVGIIKGSLNKKGYVVDATLDGKAALDLIKENNYDIVFLDHNMPEVTGLELIKYIKENNLNTKTAMITGYPAIEGSAVKYLGADEYLTKPFNIKDIEDIIDKYKKGVKDVQEKNFNS